MDETLLHSTTELVEDADIKFEQFCPENNSKIKIYAMLRPFLDIFLEFMSNYFELMIFTAGQQDVG